MLQKILTLIKKPFVYEKLHITLGNFQSNLTKEPP